MPYKSTEDLPDPVKKLPADAQKMWMAVFNSAEEQYDDERRWFSTAWSAVNEKYGKTEAKKCFECDCASCQKENCDRRREPYRELSEDLSLVEQIDAMLVEARSVSGATQALHKGRLHKLQLVPVTAADIAEARSIAKVVGKKFGVKFSVTKGSGSMRGTVLIQDSTVHGSENPKVRIALAQAYLKAGFETHAANIWPEHALEDYHIRLAKDWDHSLVKMALKKVAEPLAESVLAEANLTKKAMLDMVSFAIRDSGFAGQKYIKDAIVYRDAEDLRKNQGHMVGGLSGEIDSLKNAAISLKPGSVIDVYVYVRSSYGRELVDNVTVELPSEPGIGLQKKKASLLHVYIPEE